MVKNFASATKAPFQHSFWFASVGNLFSPFSPRTTLNSLFLYTPLNFPVIFNCNLFVLRYFHQILCTFLVVYLVVLVFKEINKIERED